GTSRPVVAVPSLPWWKVKVSVVVVPAMASGGSTSTWALDGPARARSTRAARAGMARSRRFMVGWSSEGPSRFPASWGAADPAVRWADGARELDGAADAGPARADRRLRGLERRRGRRERCRPVPGGALGADPDRRDRLRGGL